MAFLEMTFFPRPQDVLNTGKVGSASNPNPIPIGSKEHRVPVQWKSVNVFSQQHAGGVVGIVPGAEKQARTLLNPSIGVSSISQIVFRDFKSLIQAYTPAFKHSDIHERHTAFAIVSKANIQSLRERLGSDFQIVSCFAVKEELQTEEAVVGRIANDRQEI